MFKTRLTEILGIEYPIIQGGMAWVASPKLAAAVSNAGGLGLLAGSGAPRDVIEAEIKEIRKLTDKPFGLNIMLHSPYAKDLAELVVEYDVPIVTTGAGDPRPYIKMWKDNGAVVIPVIPSARIAKRMEECGCDAVVAEGCEAGGHIGEMNTMVLIPSVAEAISIPLIAAGGIANGRTLAAAFMLGAEAVQCGTIFVASEECESHINFKNAIVEAQDNCTVAIGRTYKDPVRGIKNELNLKLQALEMAAAPFEEYEKLAAGSLRRASKEGDVVTGSVMAGQSSALVKDIRPVKAIIEGLFEEAKAVVNEKAKLFNQ